MKAVIERWLIEMGRRGDDFLFDEVDDLVAMLREWARENAENYVIDNTRAGVVGGQMIWTDQAVPLDKFGGDERPIGRDTHDDGSRKSGRGYDLRR